MFFGWSPKELLLDQYNSLGFYENMTEKREGSPHI
jgi:hypothetical protein